MKPVGKIFKGILKLSLLRCGKTSSGSPVTLDSIQLMIKPRTGFAKIIPGKISPGDGHQDILQSLLGIGK